MYVHIFPGSEVYVGITKQLPQRRWGTGGIGYKKQPVYEKILEYGWDNIQHIIIKDDVSKDEAVELEKSLVSIFRNDESVQCLNKSNGGDLGSLPHVLFQYNGNTYTSKELSEIAVDDIDYHDITTRINSRGWSIERAITQPKEHREYKWKLGEDYYTANELVEIAKNNSVYLSVDDVNNRIHKGWDIERIITQPKNKKRQPFGVGEKIYEYNGLMYNSYELSQMSPYELTSGDITNRINKHGWDVERAIFTPKKSHNKLFEYNGKMYKSTELCMLCPELHLTHNNITDRIRAGWSVKDAVETPK